MFTVRPISSNVDVDSGSQIETCSKIDANHHVVQNESNIFASEANKNDDENSSGGKTFGFQNESATRKCDANKENIATNGQNSGEYLLNTQQMFL